MAEHNIQGTQGLQPAPFIQFEFESEQPEEYRQYLLHSKVEILTVLRALIQKKALISVYPAQEDSFFLTSMISLTPDDEFLIDVSNDPEINSKVFEAEQITFTAIVDKVKIQFSLNKLAATENQGLPAFLGTIPSKLLRLQRREFFRLSPPVANPIHLCATIKHTEYGTQSIDVPLADISGGGIGLIATPEEAKFFRKGDTLSDCKVMLPNEGMLVVALCIRNMFDVTTRNGSHHIRIGCEYIELPEARMTVIQRYITRIERERKARLSGSA